MKKLLIISIILLLGTTSIFSQETFTEEIMKAIGMDQVQIRMVLNLQWETQQRIQMANAELGILKAKLTKELIRENPDMDEVEIIVGNTLKYRLQNEMDTIKLRVKLREVVGEENWRKILLKRRRVQQSSTPGSNPGSMPDPVPSPPVNSGPMPGTGPGPGRN